MSDLIFIEGVYEQQGPLVPPRTYREICEAVAAWINEHCAVRVTAEGLWNSSPTGELWVVDMLYCSALDDGMPIPARVPENAR